MAYIKEYWNDKEKRADLAQKHTKEMDRLYGEKIREAIRSSMIYTDNSRFNREYKCEVDILVEAADSVSAIMRHAKECKNRMAVLNFSSYKNPGGMFILGSKAQEECLCHESFLYNVLSEFVPTFYAWNKEHMNRALYLNRAIYTPDVVFQKNGKCVQCDVITCAAPNKSAAQNYQGVSDKENTDVLKSRIKFVLDIAKENEVEILILGAYGCGVFGQDAREVAGIFKECLITAHRCFEKIVFAIPKGRDGNLEAFESVFGAD